MVHELSRQDARRIAVRAQLLAKDRPSDLLDTVRHLTVVQLDPTNAVAPSADLVLWSRLGASYAPQDLRDAMDEQVLVDIRGLLVPAADMALHRAEMEQFREGVDLEESHLGRHEWLLANNDFRRDVLDRLRADGPLTRSEIPDSAVLPWPSSGWNANRNVTMMLDTLVQRGEVAAAGGVGKDKLYDLASRIYPDDPVVPLAEAKRIKDERRLRALGIARATGQDWPVEPVNVGHAGEAAVVEGVRGEWRVDPTQLGQPFAGRAALLSPFDRLHHNRKRMTDLFAFDYSLEMFKPEAKRRWGYYALPVLYGDRLVGKLDARADHDRDVLRVAAVHRDVEFSTAMAAAVDREIADLASWLELALERAD